MMMKIILVILISFMLGGCATQAKKQTVQPPIYEKSQHTYQQDTYSRDYDREEEQSYESYEKPAKKAEYSEPVQLSTKQIQRALKNAGFYQGAIDGKIGPKTKEAIVKFQKASGLKADGIIGKKTSAELNKYFSR